MGLVESEDNFKNRMSRLGVSSATIEKIIHSAPVVIREEMTLGDARQYADAIQHAGGIVNIKEYGVFNEPERFISSFHIQPLGNFTMCHECGYKQLKAETCVKCGSILNKRQNGKEQEYDRRSRH